MLGSLKNSFKNVIINSLQYKGVTYKNDFCLTTRQNGKGIKFHKIRYILINNDEEIFILSDQYDLLEFSEHYQA